MLLVNAQEMAKKYPETFEAPSKEELNKVKVGDSVKICIDNKERLWVSVTEITENLLKGTIDNCPVVLENIDYGDTISFKKENIYGIFE